MLSHCHKPPVQVVLQQFMGLKSSFHLTALLKDGLHLQSELLPWAVLGYSSSKNNVLPLGIPMRQCVCSQPDMKSKGVC